MLISWYHILQPRYYLIPRCLILIPWCRRFIPWHHILISSYHLLIPWHHILISSYHLLIMWYPSFSIQQPDQRSHDDVIKWKHFPRNWPFVRGIHRSPLNSPHKGQWRGAWMFSFICAWLNDWINNREAGDLRRHCAHNDVIVVNFLLPHDPESNLRILKGNTSHLPSHVLFKFQTEAKRGFECQCCCFYNRMRFYEEIISDGNF